MKTKTVFQITAALVTTILIGSSAYADHLKKANRYLVTITNITKGQIFSPPLLIVHNSDFHLFDTGQAASTELAALAEDGNTSQLIDLLDTLPSVSASSVAAGPIQPGQSITLEVRTDRRHTLLSLAGMLVTTNDAFVALKGVPLRNNQEVYAKAYDAGSEFNSENCAYIPGPPCENGGGVRDTEGAEGFVHIHSGIHGIGDLEPSQDDWQNPVAKIMIQKTR